MEHHQHQNPAATAAPAAPLGLGALLRILTLWQTNLTAPPAKLPGTFQSLNYTQSIHVSNIYIHANVVPIRLRRLCRLCGPTEGSKFTKVHESSRKFTEVHGSTRKSMGKLGNPKKSKEIRRNPKKSQEIIEFSGQPCVGRPGHTDGADVGSHWSTCLPIKLADRNYDSA